jgi:hypothetical protein
MKVLSPTRIAFCDLFCINSPRISQIANFSQCLHHCLTYIKKSDPELADIENTI